MRLVRLVVVGAALAASSFAVPASAHSPLPPAPTMRVTGAVQPFSSYLRQGLSPQRAAWLMELDHLARSGVSIRLLNAALDASEQSASVSASASAQVFSSLDPAGNLDRRGADDVLESRYSSSGSSTTLSLVARDGATGQPLWSRTERITNGFVFALGTPVAGRPGVVLVAFPFGKPNSLTGLDGSGHQLWKRTLTSQVAAPAPPPAVGVITSEGGYHYTFLAFDEPVRRGAREILEVEGDVQYARGDAGGGETGAVAFSAIDKRTGAVRRLPGAVSSANGLVLGEIVTDADGDGLTDGVVAVGGSTRTASALRFTDGSTAWSTTFGDDLAGLAVIRSVTGERANRVSADDVVVLTVPSPPPAGLPLPSTAVPEALLLGGHTGRVAWTKRADGLYVVDRVGRPALGTWVDSSSTTGAQDVAQADVTVYDAAGRSLWAHSYRRSQAKHDTSDQAFVLVGSIGDVDLDGGGEGVVFFVFFTANDGGGDAELFRSRDGEVIATPQQYPLGGRVRRGVEDLVQVKGSSTGLRVTVTDRQHLLVWRRTVPNSKGISDGYAYASSITHHTCADVLVVGSGKAGTVSALLASNGQVRWSVTRTGSGLGAVVRPASPRISC
jgi:hypothetical protein